VSDPILQEPHDANADAGNLDVEQAQDQYINMVVIGSTQLSPLSLLAETQKIEESLGRPARHGFHTPRTIDIDLIAIGSTQVCSDVLTLPHKEAMNRLFVLLPLAELRPDYCFAMQTKPIAQLITQAPQISINPQSTEAR
jgi:2-amino-4-hydroxy-6-hydroxymethyldihydropteridine diphosphokinase